jgi:O-antigen biosynthesis protein WbqP
MFKRSFDILFSLLLIGIVLLPIILIAVLIKISSRGPIIYWSERIGKNGEIFMMPKFRSMEIHTPELETEKLINPEQYYTLIGNFLRKTSIDELPQFYSVILGNMSIVGPRPALSSQSALREMRKKLGIEALKPGITGLAQINGRDDLSTLQKVELENDYLLRKNFLLDLKIIFTTAAQVAAAFQKSLGVFKTNLQKKDHLK